MAGIAGIDSQGRETLVARFLDRIVHRGAHGSKILSQGAATLGSVWSEVEESAVPAALNESAVWDDSPPMRVALGDLRQMRRPFAFAVATAEGVLLARDPLGVCPLYYGYADDGALCFASEVKALLAITTDIREFPPGTRYDTRHGFRAFAQIESQEPLQPANPDALAVELRRRLGQAVQRRIDCDIMGVWLSGGLDSSAIAALARPRVQQLHSFAVGTRGAPDLAFAQQVADWLGTCHHQIEVTLDDVIAVLPRVIYHLESFDALLVRSSVVNYLVAQRAADAVGSVFSGEGADELFAGYAYLKSLNPEQLPAELVEITHRLHNTALQRVDRSSGAHSLVAHVPFLDPDVVEYVLRIPPQLKLWREDAIVEKWILRRALTDLLPEEVLWRGKAKFWQGAGIGENLADHLNSRVSDADFARERHLSNGWVLNTKEELAYYRLFREQFGELDDLTWMGRTKGAPIH